MLPDLSSEASSRKRSAAWGGEGARWEQARMTTPQCDMMRGEKQTHITREEKSFTTKILEAVPPTIH